MKQSSQTINNSGLRPLGRAILVETYEPERKAGLIVIPQTAESRMEMTEQRAVVLALGPHCYPDEPPRCQPGDKVLVSNLAGMLVRGTKDGKIYRMVNDRDVYAMITEENSDE